MATQTKVLISDPAQGFRIEYDYDDSVLRITTIRAVNTGGHDVRVTATRVSDGVSHQQIFEAGQTQVLVVPTGPATRLQLALDALGRLNGVSWRITPL
jgi:hypothetical protein